MGEIRGRLLIGGMVLRNLEGSLEGDALDSESAWAGYLWLEPPQQECLQLGRSYRLELDDERAGQIEITHIECVPGQRRLRVHLQGRSPLKWSPLAHEHHHHSVITPVPAAILGDA